MAKLPKNRVARAVEWNEPRGLMKVVADSGTHPIVGAVVLGIDNAEIMAMLQIAMMSNMPCISLRDRMFAHRTLAGSPNNLFAALDG